MVRTALYPQASQVERARISLEADAVSLTLASGQTRRHGLDGCAVLSVDATCRRRFVKMLILERAEANVSRFVVEDRLTVITPPDRGAIAPGVVRVSTAPHDAVVIETEDWEILAAWLTGGGRLAACSVAELARLACIASPQFAVVIGEVAAAIAIDAVWQREGPLRGGNTLEDSLWPLQEAARRSPQAAEALLSALSRASVAPRARRRTR
ncbi:MAG: hypothetical protein IPI49_15965 [Myxococcales bacterium]|nr:hypothetical protein [Myxococcales bacterium]